MKHTFFNGKGGPLTIEVPQKETISQFIEDHSSRGSSARFHVEPISIGSKPTPAGLLHVRVNDRVVDNFTTDEARRFAKALLCAANEMDDYGQCVIVCLKHDGMSDDARSQLFDSIKNFVDDHEVLDGVEVL